MNGRPGLELAVERGLWFIAGKRADRFVPSAHRARLMDGSTAPEQDGELPAIVADHFAYSGTAVDIPLAHAFYDMLRKEDGYDVHEDTFVTIEEDYGLELSVSSSAYQKMRVLGHITLHFMHPDDITPTREDTTWSGGHILSGRLHRAAKPLATATLMPDGIDWTQFLLTP